MQQTLTDIAFQVGLRKKMIITYRTSQINLGVILSFIVTP